MFVTNPLFWQVLGLGLLVPSAFITIISITTMLRAQGAYTVDKGSLFKFYILALLGAAIFVGVTF